MKSPLFVLTSLLSVLSLSAAVKPPSKSAVVHYAQNIPDEILNKAMDAIRYGGGIVTHKYTLFKGFAATAPAKAFDVISSLSDGDYAPTIEEDTIITTAK